MNQKTHSESDTSLVQTRKRRSGKTAFRDAESEHRRRFQVRQIHLKTGFFRNSRH